MTYVAPEQTVVYPVMTERGNAFKVMRMETDSARQTIGGLKKTIAQTLYRDAPAWNDYSGFDFTQIEIAELTACPWPSMTCSGASQCTRLLIFVTLVARGASQLHPVGCSETRSLA